MKQKNVNMDKTERGPLILALETSSRIGSVAVAFGQKLVSQTYFTGPMRHSSEIFPAISSLMKDINKKPHDIEHVYISGGPGSFTGLRIAVSIAKMMHLADNKVKIVKLDTLDVIAANVIDFSFTQNAQNGNITQTCDSANEKIAVIVDAKRGQFFVAVYEVIRRQSQNLINKIVPDSLMSVNDFHERFASSQQTIKLLGDGLLYYKGHFENDGVDFFEEKFWSPRASNVHKLGWQKALLGQFDEPVGLIPFYLRRPDAKVKIPD